MLQAPGFFHWTHASQREVVNARRFNQQPESAILGTFLTKRSAESADHHSQTASSKSMLFTLLSSPWNIRYACCGTTQQDLSHVPQPDVTNDRTTMAFA